ncbi:MAG: hypothetical protein FH749_09405 [Firmicutes bacterium]|nr:hypothetical protein [Bacillota bacterium]
MKIISIILIAVLCLSLIPGCGMLRRPETDQNLPQQPSPPNQSQQPNAPQQPPPDQGLNQTPQTSTINSQAESVNGVQSASSIVIVTSALIGVELESDTDTSTVKEQVAREVESNVSGITDAAVTADPELVTRIRQLNSQLQEGRPITEILDEFTEIWRRVRLEQ